MLLDPVQILAAQLTEKKFMLASAESCTGGLLAATLTELPGASSWFDRALITYTNAAKHSLLGVPTDLLQERGAVSDECALAMLAGLFQNSDAMVGVAITGIAGPDGGSVVKPVGTVYFAFGVRDTNTLSSKQIFLGDRNTVRAQAVAYAIEQLIRLLRCFNEI
jgi:nicotinamide-nucleotide amidase